ncbi:bcl-2-related protein A1-like [Anneissia japonica]|uniref:bcl-2-related protein A1-like n=1 Tax=Anneissia japonica TaxID=1529436 RepID=UPI001425AA78|nr:bcl-2-related protein A1-like [Anneissia japonica]
MVAGQAKKLSDAYIEYKVNDRITWDSPLLFAVIRITEQIEKEYIPELSTFSGFCPEQLITRLKEKFAGEEINWSRIMILYLLCALIAKGKSENEIFQLKKYTGEFVIERFGDWISENGGWESFVFFNADDFPVDESTTEIIKYDCS